MNKLGLLKIIGVVLWDSLIIYLLSHYFGVTASVGLLLLANRVIGGKREIRL